MSAPTKTHTRRPIDHKSLEQLDFLATAKGWSLDIKDGGAAVLFERKTDGYKSPVFHHPKGARAWLEGFLAGQQNARSSGDWDKLSVVVIRKVGSMWYGYLNRGGREYLVEAPQLPALGFQAALRASTRAVGFPALVRVEDQDRRPLTLQEINEL